jgi:rhamnosyltransferase
VGTRIGAVVVLYHPEDEHLTRLAELRHQCDRIVAVDNSDPTDPAAVHSFEAAGIDVVHNANRGGIAGAHNRGMERLFAGDVDAVVLFDQDSRVPDDFLPAMRDAIETLGPDRAFAAGPRIYDENDGRFLPELLATRYSMRLLRLEPSMPPQPCTLLVASGLVVSREAWTRLGGFDEDLVIDQVDTEYCIRALVQGIPFYVVPSLVLHHQVGEKRWHRFGPLRFISMNHPAARRYYQARNGLHISRTYGRTHPTPALLPNLFSLWQVLQVLLFEPAKADKLRALWYGTLDGVAGRLGPIEATRPAFAARLRSG